MNDQIKNPDFDPAAMAAEITEITERVHAFRENIGGLAISAAEQAELIDAVNLLEAETKSLRYTAEEADTVEAFGNEESYYTVYSLFCDGDNPGTAYTPEEIYDHLALSYDMRQETIETLSETLSDWAVDIESDAEKNGLTGTFIEHEGKYVFALNRPLKRSPEATPRRVELAVELLDEPAKEIPDDKAEPEHEAETAPEGQKEQITDNELAILEWFGQLLNGKGLKKPAVVKESAVHLSINPGAAAVIIDAMIKKGLLFSCKPQSNHAAVLMMSPPEGQEVTDRPEIVQSEADKA